MIEYIKTWIELKSDRRAVTALEYALIAGVIVATILVGFNVLAGDMSNKFNSIGGLALILPPLTASRLAQRGGRSCRRAASLFGLNAFPARDEQRCVHLVITICKSACCLPVSLSCWRAALHDMAARTVPNWMAAALAVLGLMVQADQRPSDCWRPRRADCVHRRRFCWRRGWMGGGDVKLLGAIAIVVPAGHVFHFIAAVTLTGAALAVIYLIARPGFPGTCCGRPAAADRACHACRMLAYQPWRAAALCAVRSPPASCSSSCRRSIRWSCESVFSP